MGYSERTSVREGEGGLHASGNTVIGGVITRFGVPGVNEGGEHLINM